MPSTTQSYSETVCVPLKIPNWLKTQLLYTLKKSLSFDLLNFQRFCKFFTKHERNVDHILSEESMAPILNKTNLSMSTKNTDTDFK